MYQLLEIWSLCWFLCIVNRNVLYYEDINFMSNVKVMYHLISLGNRNYLYAFYCVPPELTKHQLLVQLVGPKKWHQPRPNWLPPNEEPTKNQPVVPQMKSQLITN